VYQSNANISLLLIGIETAGGIQTGEFVQYVPANNLATPNTLASSPPYYNFNDVVNPYYFIYDIQPFLDMINTALAAAVTGSLIGATAPFYTFNPLTQLISLTVAQGFINTGAKIFMNSLLKIYLDSFVYTTKNYVNSGPYLYYHNLSDVPTGPTGGPYVYEEEYISIPLWFDIQKIVVTSNSIPIIREATPSSATIFSANVNTTANYLPIITDYIVSYDNLNDISTVLTYNPTAQYRLTDMSSNVPLVRIQLAFYWQSKIGYLFPIYVSPNQSLTAKIAFFRKTLYIK
jgi:hypothetical protein